MDAPRLGFFHKLWFGVGQSAEGMKNAGFGTFLLIYYSQILGLNPALAGAVLLIALVFDAVTDPLTGSLSDTWRGRFGRRHGFMYAAALPMAVTFYFVWAPNSARTTRSARASSLSALSSDSSVRRR
jgi:Na+/melibiose symporter-like transporter